MNVKISRGVSAGLMVAFLVPAAALLSASDWPEWRGGNRTGVSSATGLPSTWSLDGQNLAWKVPYGGRSAPVVFGDRLYLQNASGSGPTLQERVMAFNADTGKLLWEHKYNLFTSDVPPHRIAWASPAVDPATGNVFAFSGNGLLMSLSPDGKLLWERSLAEEFGMWTTHGGRVSSPVIDGNQLIVSGLTFLWGQHAGGAHRFISLDKTNGQTIWVSSPEGRPTDTIYANPFIADVNGTRTFFSGGSDGAMHALKVATGEPVWNWKVSQRGLNTAALVLGSRRDRQPQRREHRARARWACSRPCPRNRRARSPTRTRAGSSAASRPATHRRSATASASTSSTTAACCSRSTSRPATQLWQQTLGTIAKASPVLADGKLYIGTENTGDAGGKFFIIRPHADRAEVLDQDWLGTPREGRTDHRVADRGSRPHLRDVDGRGSTRSVRRARAGRRCRTDSRRRRRRPTPARPRRCWLRQPS